MVKNNKNTKILAVTGGIGTGKSLVCKVFSVLGALVYSADQRAKDLIQNSDQLKYEIGNLLGKEAYDAQGNYDRVFVAKKVFQDNRLLSRLNTLVHPFVRQDFIQFVQLNHQAPLIVYEIALLASKEPIFDYILWIDTPLNVRIDRIKKRDSRTKEQILAIIKNQPTKEQFLEIADFVICNDNSKSILKQIAQINGLLNR